MHYSGDKCGLGLSEARSLAINLSPQRHHFSSQRQNSEP